MSELREKITKLLQTDTNGAYADKIMELIKADEDHKFEELIRKEFTRRMILEMKKHAPIDDYDILWGKGAYEKDYPNLRKYVPPNAKLYLINYIEPGYTEPIMIFTDKEQAELELGKLQEGVNDYKITTAKFGERFNDTE